MRYELVRSNRKTLALTVERDGKLTVRAPQRMPIAQIEAFVQQKQTWVQRALERLAALPPREEPLALDEGATIPYLGNRLMLKRAQVSHIVIAESQLLLPHTLESPAAVVRFLEAQARRELQPRIARFAQEIDVHPGRFRLTSARGRWGSMSARGTLSLNRALIHCPPAVIDYVVIHELCHIRHPNHSSAFWALVEQHCPAYRTHRDWLKIRSSLIMILPRH